MERRSERYAADYRRTAKGTVTYNKTSG